MSIRLVPGCIDGMLSPRVLLLLAVWVSAYMGAEGQRCKKVYNVGSTKIIRSPGYPDTKAKQTCRTYRYTINFPAQTTITTTCTKFNIKCSRRRFKNYLRIDNTRKCGTSFPTTTSTSNRVVMSFKSENYKQNRRSRRKNFIFSCLFKTLQQQSREVCAVANIFGGGLTGEHIGQVKFYQLESSSLVTVTGSIRSLTPGKHGFHIHQCGSTEEGCRLAKGHFNPFFVAHGSRLAPERHVGDLGNIVADGMGVSNFTFTDNHITLYQDSAASIVGRAVVVHAGEDDLGLGGDIGSFKTGNAGGRVGCGVIGITKCSAELKKSGGLIAQASLYKDAASTKGTVTFYQESPTSPVVVRGMVSNFHPYNDALHGFHIHEFGDTGDNCKAAGSHFNPEGVPHGAPQDRVRHVGDLGNIQDINGTAMFCIKDEKITLYPGVNSIVGRAVVVHQGEDDLGRGGDAGSVASGNAGARLTCGVVGLVDKNDLEESIAEDMCL